jgi:hypothetical protein
MDSPFESILADSAAWRGTRINWMDGAQSELAITTDWVALPLVEIGRAFLQTLVDPHSDGRRLIVFDSTGTIMQQSAIDGAIAFVAADSSNRVLFGARITTHAEIVVYRWRWE